MIKENMPAHFDIGINEGSEAAGILGYGNAQENHFMIKEQHRRQISSLLSLAEGVKEEKR